MKDFLGNEIEVGDTVVAIRRKYRELIKCKVLRITPKMVFIVHENLIQEDGTFRDGVEFKQFHEEVVVIEKIHNKNISLLLLKLNKSIA